MKMRHSDVDALRNYSARTKVPDIKTTIVVDRSFLNEVRRACNCAQSFQSYDFVASIGR